MGAVFAVLADFLFLEYTEGFRGIVGALHVGGVEDVAQLVAGQAVGASVEGVEISAQVGAAFLIPREGRAVMSEIASKGSQCVGRVGQFQNLGDKEGETGLGVEGWREDRELLVNEEI